MGTDSEMTYSVLMAVYGKENPEFLRQSIESMLNQTLPFSDFVLPDLQSRESRFYAV